MTDGSSQGLFVVVAVVIFGIFVGISYLLFRENLTPSLSKMFCDSFTQVSKQTGFNAGECTGNNVEDDLPYTIGVYGFDTHVLPKIHYASSLDDVGVLDDTKNQSYPVGNVYFVDNGDPAYSEIIIRIRVDVFSEAGRDYVRLDSMGVVDYSPLVSVGISFKDKESDEFLYDMEVDPTYSFKINNQEIEASSYVGAVAYLKTESFLDAMSYQESLASKDVHNTLMSDFSKSKNQIVVYNKDTLSVEHKGLKLEIPIKILFYSNNTIDDV